MTTKFSLGYRVKSSDGIYVHRHGTILSAHPEVTEPTSKADAYRLMADWLDAGYIPTLVHVTQRV